MNRRNLKGRNSFTVSEDIEIKNLLTIFRAVSKERQISIKETLRIDYGFYTGHIKNSTTILKLENYEELKVKGIIKLISDKSGR